MTRHIVIVGGGFGGTALARRLERRLPEDVQLTLVSEESTTTFNPLLAEVVGAEFQPDQEHVQAHPQLRHHVQRSHGGLGEQRLLHLRQQQPEERGAEHHAGDHLAHHLRLAQALREPADQLADGDDDRRLREEIHGKLGGGHLCCRRLRDASLENRAS